MKAVCICSTSYVQQGMPRLYLKAVLVHALPAECVHGALREQLRQHCQHEMKGQLKSRLSNLTGQQIEIL